MATTFNTTALVDLAQSTNGYTLLAVLLFLVWTFNLSRWVLTTGVLTAFISFGVSFDWLNMPRAAELHACTIGFAALPLVCNMDEKITLGMVPVALRTLAGISAACSFLTVSGFLGWPLDLVLAEPVWTLLAVIFWSRTALVFFGAAALALDRPEIVLDWAGPVRFAGGAALLVALRRLPAPLAAFLVAAVAADRASVAHMDLSGALTGLALALSLAQSWLRPVPPQPGPAEPQPFKTRARRTMRVWLATAAVVLALKRID